MKRKNVVTFEMIADSLPDLESKTLKEITEIMGYRNEGVAKAALYGARAKKKIDFVVNDGIYSDFELLDPNSSRRHKETKQTEELTAFKTWLAVSSVYRLNSLLDAKTLKPKEELEAIKELGRIERSLTSPKATEYAKKLEEQMDVFNIWQMVTD